MLITFSGIDNAGKSTQIELLKNELTAKKISFWSTWSRGGYTPVFSFVKKLVRRNFRGALPSPGKSRQRDEMFQNKKLQKLWLTLAIIDLILFYGLYFRIKNILNEILIADRYLMDTEIDFMLNFPNVNFKKWKLWKFLKAVALKPAHSFMLMIPVEESEKRSVTKNEPFPDPEPVRLKRFNSYHILNQDYFCNIIDCMHPVDEVYKIIKENIERKKFLK